MDFYTSIAPFYDRIFPPDPDMARWLAGFLPAGGRFLDLGCATGAVAVDLERLGFGGTGIDLDEEMIAAATARAQAAGCSQLAFHVVDMTRLTASFPVERFALVTCFGNTLVHLADPLAITGCCRQVRELLEPGGRFIGQIIGYDRILDGDVPGLPTIEQHGIRFERSYLREDGPARLVFATKLTVHETGREIVNRIPLVALRKSSLEACLRAAGFTDVTIGRDPQFDPWDASAYAVWFQAVA